MSLLPVPVPLEEVRTSVLQENEGELVVCSLMQDIVDEATQLMIDNHLDRVAIPYTVRCVTREMMDFIHSAFIGQDRGDVRQGDAWTSGTYPGAITVDSWARGAVDVKAKSHADDAAAKMNLANPAAGGEGTGGLTSTVSKLRSRQSNAALDKKLSKYEKSADGRTDSVPPSSQGGRAGGGTGKGPNGASGGKKKKGDLNSTQNGGSGDGGEGVNGLDPNDPTQQLSQEEVEYASKVKADQKKKQETKQLAEKLTKQMDEMKNVRDFVVDGGTGKVIAVKQFDGKQAAAGTDKGNSKRPDMRFNVGGDSDPATEIQTKDGKGASGKGGKGSSTRVSVPQRKKKDGSDFVQEENTSGPMIEGVQPSGGVVVKEGDATRRQDLKVPKTKMTRSEYKKMVDTHVVNQDPDAPPGEVDADGNPVQTGKNSGVAGKAKLKDSENPNVTSLPPTDTSSKAKEAAEAKKRQQQQREEAQSSGVTQSKEFRAQKAATLPGQTSPPRGAATGQSFQSSSMINSNTRTDKSLAMQATVKQRAMQTQQELQDRKAKSRQGMTVANNSYFEDDEDE